MCVNIILVFLKHILDERRGYSSTSSGAPWR